MKGLLRHIDPARVRTVVDCGANVGAWTRWAYRHFPNAHVYAFEPNAPVALGWIDWTSTRKRVTLGVQALGERTGEVDFNVNDFSPASSILKRTELCVELYPKTQHTERTRVHMTRLDDALPEDLEGELLIKMDCQGYEAKIIAGAPRTLSKAKLVVCEVMLREIYEGQPTYAELVALFAEHGLDYAGTISQEYVGGVLTFSDVVFKRNGVPT